MATRAKIVVSRSEDRVVLMIPGQLDDVRSHAIMGEDEAYCASSAIRRMVQSRERRELVLGSETSGVRIERVDHAQTPVEIQFDDEHGVTVADLTRDDALGIADMLWGAHRAQGPFHAMGTIVGGVRRCEHRHSGDAIIPRPDVDLGDARLIGDINRRLRGERPETKN